LGTKKPSTKYVDGFFIISLEQIICSQMHAIDMGVMNVICKFVQNHDGL
jgi:hypothetical protein